MGPRCIKPRLPVPASAMAMQTGISPESDGDMAENSKKKAATQFAKLQRESDAKLAVSEYESTARALRAKTERLKALRLARDAASPPKMGIDPKRKGKKKDAGRLSDWLDGQAKEGRRG